MKKIFTLVLLLLLFALLLVSCSNNETEKSNEPLESSQTHNSNDQSDKKDEIPEGEYVLTVDEEHKDLLYEPLKKSYKAGERVTVKTPTIHDVSIDVKLNGKEIDYVRSVDGEEGYCIYNEYEFVMPEKHSVLSVKISGGMGLGCKVTLNDPNGQVINRFFGTHIAGGIYEINTYRCDLRIKVNGTPIEKEPTPIKNIEGEILFYQWEIKLPFEDVEVQVNYLDEYEPILWKLTFNNQTGYDNLFSDTISGEYAHGETINITVNSDYLVEDHGIILKANGKLIEETDIYQWKIVMPDDQLAITAYLINSSIDENWHYLNIEDESGLLLQLGDRYYQEGTRVTLYSNVLLNLDADCEINVLDYLYMESEGIYEYKFIMPRNDVTLKISEYKNQ